jgi:hypothetical protein
MFLHFHIVPTLVVFVSLVLALNICPLAADEVRPVLALNICPLAADEVRHVLALFFSIVRPVGWCSSLLKYACCFGSTLHCRFCPAKAPLSALLVLFLNQQCQLPLLLTCSTSQMRMHVQLHPQPLFYLTFSPHLP